MKKATYDFVTSINGMKTLQSGEITADNAISSNPTLLAAITGTLTTRTDNDTGILTVATGHGILTSDTIGIGWYANGVWNYQHNVDVTAVTGTTISIDLGVGTNLPAQNTADIRISKKSDDSFNSGGVVTEDIKALGITAAAEALAVLWDGVGGSKVFTLTPTTGFHYVQGIMRSHFTDLHDLLSGITSDTDLASIHWYNFSTSANKVRAEALFD